MQMPRVVHEQNRDRMNILLHYLRHHTRDEVRESIMSAERHDNVNTEETAHHDTMA